MALMTLAAAVSFAKTPLAEIWAKAAEIEGLGWTERDRGDPWAVSYEKLVPEEERDPEAELRRVMGEYWLTADDIRVLRESTARHRRLF